MVFSCISLFLPFYEINARKRLNLFVAVVKFYFSPPVFVCQSGTVIKCLEIEMNTDYQRKKKEKKKKPKSFCISITLEFQKSDKILKDTEWQKKKEIKMKR